MSTRNYRQKKIQQNRYDAMVDRSTGRGTRGDKLSHLRPSGSSSHTVDLRNWYRSNGFIQNIIDSPAEDATREWISITTNLDQDNPETGQKGLNISRMIMNRLTELKAQDRLSDLIRYSRTYALGGFLYIGVDAQVPQAQHILKEAIPREFDRIAFLNVFGPDNVAVRQMEMNPLSRKYHHLTFSVSGFEVHPSRLIHMVEKWMPEEQTGISIIDTIMDAIKAQDTALWSVNSMLYILALWVFKSPAVNEMAPAELAEFLASMQSVLSTQKSCAVGEGESIDRVGGGQSLTGVKEVFDFVFENLAGMAKMPKSKLMGQSQGTITAGQYDLIAYYDSVAKYQELRLRLVIEHLITLIIREKKGEIYQALDGKVESLDWEFEFEPLWKLAPKDEADVKLKDAQTHQIDISDGVITPTQSKQIRYKDLETYSKWEDAPIDFTPPELTSADENSEEDDPEKTAQNRQLKASKDK